MLVATLPEVNTPIKTKSVPLPIQVTRALIEDRVPSRLGQDAFTVAVVLIDLMDRLVWRPVGLYMSQLCDACGFPTACPRRARAARAALIADGWLLCAIPKSGERTQAVYEMILKTTPVIAESNPGQNDPAKQLTAIRNDPGQVDPGQNDPSPRSKRPLTPVETASDPGRFGTPSNPITLHTPNKPSNTNTPLPPEGEVFVLESPESENQSPGRKAKRKTESAVADIQTTEFPTELQSAEFKTAWAAWLQHRKERGKPLTPTAAASRLRQLAALGEKRALEAVVHSTASNWEGVFEPNHNRGKGSDFFGGIKAFAEERGGSDLFASLRRAGARRGEGSDSREGFEFETANETTATSGGSEFDFE